jgi:hypothetical protein
LSGFFYEIEIFPEVFNMGWMIHSMANGRCWIGSINIYMELEELLGKYNQNLKLIDSYDGTFFDWLAVTDDYSKEMLDAIEMALSDERLDVVIENHLLVMREVFKNGTVIMG